MEREIELKEAEIEVEEQPKVQSEKEADATQKIIPIPLLPTPFSQILVKKTEEGKYRKFNSMLK